MNQPSIPAHTLEQIAAIVEKFPEIEEIRLFGSRALHTHREASDIDVVITGSMLTSQIRALFALALEESTIPYFFDLLLPSEVKDLHLKEHIKRHGVVIYEKKAMFAE